MVANANSSPPADADADAEDDPDFETVVRDAVDKVLANPMRGNVVGMADIDSDARVQAVADVSEDALRTKIGTVLSNADYATKVARNKYRIDDE